MSKWKSKTLAYIFMYHTNDLLLLTSNEFINIRDLACARLTLFNARSGGEAARLKLSDWTYACHKLWFDVTRVQNMANNEKELIEISIIMYQTAKE